VRYPELCPSQVFPQFVRPVRQTCTRLPSHQLNLRCKVTISRSYRGPQLALLVDFAGLASFLQWTIFSVIHAFRATEQTKKANRFRSDLLAENRPAQAFSLSCCYSILRLSNLVTF
jgi:hypothetical protein